MNETCSEKNPPEDNKLFDYIMSTCTNTVWITGSVDCSNMTSYAEKIFYSKKDADKTLLRGKNLRLGMIIVSRTTYGKHYTYIHTFSEPALFFQICCEW